jgi:hypothetical protein
MDNACMAIQKTWEEDFWTNMVKKGGRDFEEGDFKEEYWMSKAADKYPLLRPDGSIYPTSLKCVCVSYRVIFSQDVRCYST